ncbi:hypothetical protein D9M72_442420 [compost metagenome]
MVDGEIRVDLEHLVPIAPSLLVTPGATVEAGEIEARHVGSRRQRQPAHEGDLGLVETAEVQQGPPKEMQRQVELRIEPMRPRIERQRVFELALKIPDRAEGGMATGGIGIELDHPLGGAFGLIETPHPAERD